MARRTVKQEEAAEDSQEHYITATQAEMTQDINMYTNGETPSANATLPFIPTPASRSNSTVRNDDVDMTNGDENLSAMQAVSSRSRQLIQAIRKLEALGIDATLTSLPKVVVIGDQSSGKSSILEAVCDINLPRSQGTCTRCPYQITTTSTAEGEAAWSCKVTLHRKFEYTLQTRAGKDSRNARWAPVGSLNAFHFETVHDKTELSEVLHRAQLAILSPHRDPAEFLHVALPGPKSQVAFSPNVISLEVAEEGLPELSFFDLPGAINVHEDEREQHLVGFIEQLLKTYLKDDKALILLAVASDQDTENSTAFKFVGQSKAKPRCMGVLTKPDLMSVNRLEHVKRILSGQTFVLGKNWYVTRQLSQEELEENVSHHEAREREKHFFSNKEPWCTSLAGFASRFGVPALQDVLSKELTAHIVNELPTINARVLEKLESINVKLAEFPDPAKEPCLTVMNEIDNLRAAITDQLRGDGLVNEFRERYRILVRKLRTKMAELRPHIALGTPGFTIYVSESSDEETTPASEQTPTKSRKGNDGSAITAPSRASLAPRTPRTIKRENTVSPAPTKPIFKLDQVKQRYDSGSVSNLPGQINPKVTDHIILQSLSGWRSLIEETLTEIEGLLGATIAAAVFEVLSNRQQTELFRHASDILDSLFSELMATQRSVIENIVLSETHKPICYADTALKKALQEVSSTLHEKRLEVRVNEYFDSIESKGGKITKFEDRKKKTTEVQAHIGADPYAREISAMVTVLSYYDVASARILDTIASLLEYGLLHKFNMQLTEKLFHGLKTANSKHCAKLLADDPAREERRCELHRDKAKLLQALEELRGLPMLN